MSIYPVHSPPQVLGMLVCLWFIGADSPCEWEPALGIVLGLCRLPKLLRIGVEAHLGQLVCGLAFLYVLVPAVLAWFGLGVNEAHESDRPAFYCSGALR